MKRPAPGLVAALAGAVALALCGCAPTLAAYTRQLEPGSPVALRAMAEPDRAPAPIHDRRLVVLRFSDDRERRERTHYDALAFDVLAAIFTLGFSPLFDALHADHANQPITGLDTELPRRVAEFVESADTFEDCSFVNLPFDALPYQRAGRGLPPGTDLLLDGSVHAFTGDWADGTPPRQCRGRIEVVLTLRDARTDAELWKAPLVVTEAWPDGTWTLAGATECTLKNRLAVSALGAFLKKTDATLRAATRSDGG